MIDSYIIIKKKDNDDDNENNAQNKDSNNKKKLLKKQKLKQKQEKKQIQQQPVKQLYITNKALTREEREKKNTCLLHPGYEKTTFSNMQRKHVH